MPASGPLLVVSNHPGAYDTMLLLASVKRNDAAIIAADRAFLRALPAFGRHLLFVPEGAATPARAAGLRRAMRHLAAGGALLHFAAGRIEPDPAFSREAAPLVAWSHGTGVLVRATARAHGVVVVAIGEAVHSARAKRLRVIRLAERFGVTTLAPLLQIAVPAYRDVRARVRFSEAVPARTLVAGTDAEITARVRAIALGLLSPR